MAKRNTKDTKVGTKVTKAASPKTQLESFLAKFTPEMAARARRALATMRKRVPGAVELVYDNYNALAIGFGPTERASDAIFSITVYAGSLNLFFLQNGPLLPDPKGRLEGEGKVVRHVKLVSDDVLDDPAVRKLMEIAMRRAEVRIDPKQKRRLVIKSVSAKQRPRRGKDK